MRHRNDCQKERTLGKYFEVLIWVSNGEFLDLVHCLTLKTGFRNCICFCSQVIITRHSSHCCVQWPKISFWNSPNYFHLWAATDSVLVKKKVKFSRYRPGVAQRVGRGIALLFHDRGTRRGWVVSRTPWPHFTHGKDPVPILQETGWAPGPVWTGRKSRPHQNLIPDHPARSQSIQFLI